MQGGGRTASTVQSASALSGEGRGYWSLLSVNQDSPAGEQEQELGRGGEGMFCDGKIGCIHDPFIASNPHLIRGSTTILGSMAVDPFTTIYNHSWTTDPKLTDPHQTRYPRRIGAIRCQGKPQRIRSHEGLLGFWRLEAYIHRAPLGLRLRTHGRTMRRLITERWGVRRFPLAGQARAPGPAGTDRVCIGAAVAYAGIRKLQDAPGPPNRTAGTVHPVRLPCYRQGLLDPRPPVASQWPVASKPMAGISNLVAGSKAVAGSPSDHKP
ncbi:hypothetical protein G7046_g9384 [Stylonectria norvegica]|nr:hypothetical protein G7046_g9384 [Stylonectria norvegica]